MPKKKKQLSEFLCLKFNKIPKIMTDTRTNDKTNLRKTKK